MKDDNLIPLLLLIAGVLLSIAGIGLFAIGNWLARMIF
jgi:hypothetical protein